MEEKENVKKDVKKEKKKTETKKEKLKIEEKELSFHEALVKALAEMPDKLPTVEGQIGHRKYNYTPLNIIVNAVRPILAKYGLGIRQDVQTFTHEGSFEVSVGTTIFNRKGEQVNSNWINSPILDIVGGNKLQALGATITYLRRYSLSAFLNIATEEDTDAETVVSEKAKNATGTAYLQYKKPKKEEEKTERPPELKAKLKEIWKKIVEAKELGILSTDSYIKQRETIQKISTMQGAKAYEEMILRLIDTEHQMKAEKMKKEEEKEIEAKPETYEVPSEAELEEDNLFEEEIDG